MRNTRVGALVVAAVLVSSLLAIRKSSEATIEITQWVAFSADFSLTHANPAHAASAGRLFRASDGSTRLETWLSGSPDRFVVSIRNIQRATYYSYRWNRGWISAPMELPSNGWKPLRVRANSSGLSPYRYKLALRRGEDGALASTTGFSADQFVNDSGNQWLLVPELNFFPVVKQWVQTGRREAVSNIVIGEPDPLLFLPPGCDHRS
jgi:hypothetical protein